eukprot:TRINITY_DN61052_c0_g1_i1.p1 TRINITY_DN61052_c0_g1~~TRINITY_DN61052_c0_g1_i1.p1  ORF type:complete len:580 (+),score=83.87 TRINITY_DN61052_c0_g1_i1:42-1742(+)
MAMVSKAFLPCKLPSLPVGDLRVLAAATLPKATTHGQTSQRHFGHRLAASSLSSLTAFCSSKSRLSARRALTESASLKHLEMSLETWKRFNEESVTSAQEAMDSLCSLEDIGLTRHWDFPLPTLCFARRPFEKRKVLSSEAFEDLLFTKLPWLKRIDFTNLVMQGGAVVDLVMGREQLNDLDFFVVGLDGQEAVNRIEWLLQELVQAEKEYINHRHEQLRKEYGANYSLHQVPSVSDLYAVRKGNAITVHSSCLGVPVSIGMTAFTNVAEGLYTADIGASAICFDGTKVLCTPLCAFSIQNMAVLVAPHLFRSQGDRVYERRLAKYCEQKGFDLILPEFDTSCIQLPHKDYGLSEIIEMPHFLLQVTSVSKNKISIDKLIVKGFSNASTSREETFYTECASSSANVHAETFYTNLAALVTDTGDFDFVAQGERIMNVLFTAPRLSNRQIEVCYDSIQEQIYPSPSCFDATKIEKYYSIPEASLENFVHEIYLRSYADEDSRAKHIKDWIMETTELQKKDAAAKLASLCQQHGQSKIAVRVGGLGKSLESAQDWYGHAFKPGQARAL